MKNRNLEAAWQEKAATNAAVTRARKTVTEAALAGVPVDRLQPLFAEHDRAVQADLVALKKVALASGYEGEI